MTTPFESPAEEDARLMPTGGLTDATSGWPAPQRGRLWAVGRAVGALTACALCCALALYEGRAALRGRAAASQDLLELQEVQCYGQVVVLPTQLGDIRITLCPAMAPVTVQKFEALVEQGKYQGTGFYRAETGFVIQGGFQCASGSSGETFPLEYKLTNKRRTVAMARTEDPNSGSGEFFVNLKDSPNLDQEPGVDPNSPEAGFDAGFTVFGVVDEASMLVAEQIAGMPTHEVGNLHMLDDPVIFNAHMDGSASPAAGVAAGSASPAAGVADGSASPAAGVAAGSADPQR